MKLFWSWQADTPGKIGRHFVRDALLDAIDVLKAEKDIIEPEREARAALHLDSDRQRVPGSPDLAATIFQKIEEASVFVADVTLLGATPDGKKLINSNVAIEYGHAHHALGDTSVLMVQNTQYGVVTLFPSTCATRPARFSMRSHPTLTGIRLPPSESGSRAYFVTALRPYLTPRAGSRPAHAEIAPTYVKAFARPHDIIADNHAPGSDRIEYNFAERQALYLRLIPVHARIEPLRVAQKDRGGLRAETGG
jgi:hypothetical protein